MIVENLCITHSASCCIALILGGDFYTGSVLATALTKLVLRFSEQSSDKRKSNALRAEVSCHVTRIIMTMAND